MYLEECVFQAVSCEELQALSKNIYKPEEAASKGSIIQLSTAANVWVLVYPIIVFFQIFSKILNYQNKMY